MVKVTAPLFSLGASGTIGKAITFSNWKGRNYVRERVIPTNPRSGGQVGARAMFKYLTQNWAALTTANKATWQDAADQLIVSTFNAYIRENQRRYATFNAPGKEDPVTEGGTADALTTFTATGGVREVVLDLACTAVTDNWGVMIFRSITGSFTPSITNCVYVKLLATTDPIIVVDTPLDPDTYYYDAKTFTDDGLFGSLKGEISAEAT